MQLSWQHRQGRKQDKGAETRFAADPVTAVSPLSKSLIAGCHSFLAFPLFCWGVKSWASAKKPLVCYAPRAKAALWTRRAWFHLALILPGTAEMESCSPLFGGPSTLGIFLLVAEGGLFLLPFVCTEDLLWPAVM